MTSAKALAELRKHGELSLVRSHWVVFTAPGDSMAVLPADVGLRLVNEGWRWLSGGVGI